MGDIWTHLKIGSRCKIGNRLYFSNMSFNGLFYLDLEDLSIHFLHKFSFARSSARCLSSSVSFVYENTIYFFPTATNVIVKYDILKQKEEIIPIQNFDGEEFVTVGIVQYQDVIYIFPFCLGKGIFVFDLQKQKVEKDRELSSLFESDFCCGVTFLVHDNCVMINSYKSNKLIEVSLDTKKIVYLKTFEESMQICAVHYGKNNYWILQNESTDIYEWDRERDILYVYKNECIEWDNEQATPYSDMIFLENEILVLNYGLKNILRINKERKVIEEPVIFPQSFMFVNDFFRGYPICLGYTVLKNKVLIYSGWGNMLLIYDKDARHISGKELLVTETEIPYLKEILKEEFVGRESCIENSEFENIENFMNIVIEGRKGKDQSAGRENIGQLIYQNVRIEK